VAIRSTGGSGLAGGRIGTLREMTEHTNTDLRDTSARDRVEAQERPPIWRNTRPRGNPAPDRHDLERSIERLEAVLGR
jgi:hypothetical protein